MELYELLGIGDIVGDKVAEYMVARKEALKRRQAVIAAFAAIDVELRIPQLMNFYWRAPEELGDKILSQQEMIALCPNVSTDAEFRLLAKRFQPTQIINCPSCTRPFVITLFRNGRQMRDKCKACASADYAAEMIERRKWEAEEEEHRREEAIHMKGLLAKVISNLVKEEPMTETKAFKAYERASLGARFSVILWHEVFDELVTMKILVPCGKTKNNRIIYRLEAQYFRESAVA